MKENTWDAFTNDVQSEASSKQPCSVQRMLDLVPANYRGDVTSIVNDPELRATSVWRALVKRIGDSAPSYNTLLRHRKSECPCGRGESFVK